jgi:hypothetical protein
MLSKEMITLCTPGAIRVARPKEMRDLARRPVIASTKAEAASHLNSVTAQIPRLLRRNTTGVKTRISACSRTNDSRQTSLHQMFAGWFGIDFVYR